MAPKPLYRVLSFSVDEATAGLKRQQSRGLDTKFVSIRELVNLETCLSRHTTPSLCVPVTGHTHSKRDCVIPRTLLTIPSGGHVDPQL